MVIRLTDALTVIARHLAPALVTPDAFDTVQGLARQLPQVTSSFGFECRLQDEAPRVDLGVTVDARDGGREALARRYHRSGGRTRVDAWRRVSAFCTRWADPTTVLYDAVPHIFLEFDCAQAVRRAAPCVFAPLTHPLSRRRAESSPRVQRDREMAMQLLRIWLGRRRLQAIEANVLACVNALPDQGRLLMVGAMLARPQQTARLCIQVPRFALRDYLRRVGWAHWSHVIDDLLNACRPQAPSAYIEFDVGRTVGPEIGLLFWGNRTRASSWPPLLNALTGRKLCTAAKRDALLRWPGVGSEALSPRETPYGFHRYISHLKVNCSPDGRLQAKAYFAVLPSFQLIRCP